MQTFLKVISVVVWLWVSCGAVFAQENEIYKRVKIYTNQHGLQQLHELGLPIDHIQNKPNAWIIGEFSESEIALIAASGFVYDVLLPDMSAYYQAQNKTQQASPNEPATKQATQNTECQQHITNFSTPQGFNLGSMGGYYTYTQMLAHLDTMFNRFPNLISAKQAIEGFTTQNGNALQWVKISDNPQTDESEEPQILFNALHHAREPVSLSQLIYFMYYLLENYETDPNIQYLVNHTEIYFIPCINPDGYLWNEFTNPNGGGMWRKNRTDNGDGTFGVDPNRNYGFMWGYDDAGSSPVTSTGTYRGAAPFSEPEIQAVKAFCEQKQLRFAFNNHSHGNLLIYPWGYQPNSETPDSSLFRAFARELTLENNFLAGTAIETVNYITNGSSDDWMYGEQATKNKIFAFTPEIGNTFTDGFWPSMQRIEPLCKSMMWHNLTALRLLHNYAILTDESPQFITSNTPQITVSVQRIGLTNANNFTLTVEPLTTNILSYPDPITITALELEETISIPLSFVLNSALTAGEPIAFNLHLNNGQGFTQTQTITKYYGQPTPVFATNCSDIEIWQTALPNATWAVTTNEYVSAPGSITDSPDGNYAAGSTNEIILQTPLDLTEATFAQLQFWAKWDIEATYDFVQVQAITADNIATALCGKYTKPGSAYQAFGEPVYDGYQPGWVLEQVDLSAFIGQSITLRFVLRSDDYDNRDGFYVDDLVVETFSYQPDTVNTSINAIVSSELPTLLPCMPNPANATTIIPYYLPNGYVPNNLQLIVTDALGRRVLAQSLPSGWGNNMVELNVQQWQQGLYFYYLQDKTLRTPPRKLLIMGGGY